MYVAVLNNQRERLCTVCMDIKRTKERRLRCRHCTVSEVDELRVDESMNESIDSHKIKHDPLQSLQRTSVLVVLAMFFTYNASLVEREKTILVL